MTYTDEELMQLFIANGSRDVFSVIYLRYFQVLCRYIHWISHGNLHTEDIAQEILVKLFHRPEVFDANRKLKVWLFVTAKNKVKNIHRNRTTQKAHHVLIKSITTATTIPEVEVHENSRPSIQAILQHLSEDHKEVVILKFSNNLTISEISEVLAISIGTVKSRLFYALQKIRSQIGKKEKL